MTKPAADGVTDLRGIIWERIREEMTRYAREYARQLALAGFTVDEIKPLVIQYIDKFGERCPAIEATVLRRLAGGDVLH